ncbi:MAG: CoA transferase [Proteobacteria bacterium]|nr:CoA transferase [Pseudomonadota bacterium]
MSAFQGVRILDLSQGLAGPMSTMLMADFGAEVLKVEPPGGDRLAHRPGYLAWNRNKLSLTLDLDAPADRAKLVRLIGGADVLVCDHAPGALEALGLDAATLTARHPRLVHVWVPPFGAGGPYAHLPEHHGMLAGLTGAAFRQGSYADQPVWHVMPLILHGQAVMAASATAAALVERARSGLGQAVTASGVHGAAEICGPIGFVDSDGMFQGHPLGGSASYRLYQCADGEWLFLATLFPHFFQRAIDALGLRKLKAFPPGVFEIGGLLTHTFAQAPRDHWVELLLAHEVPVAPVGRREDWLKSGPMADNAMRVELPHPTLGPVEMPGIAARLSETPGEVRALMRPATPDEIARFTEPRPISAAPRQPPPEDAPPLAGVRVLDLGSVIAGAYAGSILANFGADVVKVESPEGDPFRPYGTGFVNYNRGKRGLGLDLKSPEGRAAFLDMARHADVVIDNYRRGVRERLGIDYEALKAVNPHLISCSINAYGEATGLAHQPGFDPIFQARSGMMSAQGGAGQEPVFHSVAINDVATAGMVAFAVIAALNARERTGLGQNITTSLAAQSALFQSGDLTTWPGAPAAPQGEPDCVGFTALDRYYPCADGWLTLGLTTEAQADALAGVLGGAGWRQRFPDLLGQPRRGALAREIERLLSERDRDPTVAGLLAAGVPAAPVLWGDEARREEWLWQGGFYELRSHRMWGELISSRAYADFSRGGAGFTRLHPELGEHCVEVLLEYGLDRDRIRRLAEAGAIFRG